MTAASSASANVPGSTGFAGFKDLFSKQSADYARFRPRYPEAMFDYLASVAPARELAWDSGTGSGQAAGALARRFACVIATDPSRKQLESAEAFAGVGYAVGTAERSPLAPGSCDLVAAAQAFHWYDQAAFAREARRVLKPRGIVAVWCYGLCEISPSVDEVVLDLYEGVLGSYWDPERRQIEEGYARAVFPFEELTPPAFEMTASWDLARLVGYLGTWSALKKFESANGGRNALEELYPRLEAAWGSAPSEVRTVRWGLTLRLGRV